MADKSYNKTLLKIQKLANNSAVAIQKMVNESNKSQMAFNSAESQKARDWQEKMSKKSHQMEVSDLKAAGLNPVLSANGGGAQSYTTSSASTQNDSGASATGAILSESMGALTNLESARLNTEAQLKASKQQAAATRYAAMQNARAQMYASDQSASVQKYRVDQEMENARLNRKNQRWMTKNQTAGSWAGLLDKNLRNFGVYGIGKKFLKNSFDFNIGTMMRKNKDTYFTKGKFNSKNYSLSRDGMKFVNSQLTNAGFATSPRNRKLYVKAVVFQDRKSLGKLIANSPYATRPGYR